MPTELTRKQVLCIGWTISLSAGVFLIGVSAISAATRSGWIALGAFVVGMAVIGGTVIALFPAWRGPFREMMTLEPLDSHLSRKCLS